MLFVYARARVCVCDRLFIYLFIVAGCDSSSHPTVSATQMSRGTVYYQIIWTPIEIGCKTDQVCLIIA